MTPSDACQLSVVLPYANERENLTPLILELEAALQALGRSFEVICVDDGSTDGGGEVLRSLQATRPWLRVYQHRKILARAPVIARASGWPGGN